MSETPRTDQDCGYYDLRGYWTHNKNGSCVLADFARQLEHELNVANDRIKQLEAVINDPEALWSNLLRGTVKLPSGIGDVRQYQECIKRLEDQGNELREEEAHLLNTIGELKRRIKRLEDGGDEMFKWSERVGQEYWTKAKEDKL